MPPLDRALALDERQHGAVLIAEQLHLDVARPRRAGARDRSAASPNAALRFRPRGANARPADPPAARHDAHALAAAAGDGLDQQRIADARRAPSRSRRRRRRRSSGSSVPGTTGTPAAIAALARRGLAAHQRDRFGVGPMNVRPGVAARRGEVVVLGEKAVAGMDRVGAGLVRRVDDRDRCAGSSRAARSGRSAHASSAMPHVAAPRDRTPSRRRPARCPCRGTHE